MDTIISLNDKFSLHVAPKEEIPEIIANSIKRQSPFVFLPASLNDISFLTSDYYSKIYKLVDFIVPDGMPLVWYAKFIKKIPHAERIYGPEIMEQLLRNPYIHSLKHIFFGPSEKTNTQLKNMLQKKRTLPLESTFVVVPYPFDNDIWSAFIQRNIKTSYDICWIGLSSPLQVKFGIYLKKKNIFKGIFCVGAAFRLLSQEERMAPSWMQQAGLEWFFRLIHEPKRLSHRYLIHIPTSIFKLILSKKINL